MTEEWSTSTFKAKEKKSSKLKYGAVGIMGVLLISAVIFFLNDNTVTGLVVDDTAAVIGDVTITWNQVNDRYSKIPDQAKETITPSGLLKQMVEQEILYQEAQLLGIGASIDEAEEYLLTLLQMQGLGLSEFETQLRSINISKESVVEDYRRQLAIQRLLNESVVEKIEISPEEIVQFYEENREGFNVDPSVTVRHILVNSEAQSAQSILAELDEDNFCENVEKYSTDTASIENCGEYTFTRNDPYVEEFKELSFKQNPGEMGIVETQFGEHIIWTVEKHAAKNLELAEVSEEIISYLKIEQAQMAYESYYDALEEKYSVRIINASSP